MISREQQWQAVRFIRALSGDAAGREAWQVFDDRKLDTTKAATFHGSVHECANRMITANAQNCGVFVSICATDGIGRGAAHVTRVRALFVDCDKVRPARWHLPPSIVVESVAGPHAYWLVDDCPTPAFAEAQKRLALHYDSDPVVHNLSRVMRVPGFLHCKGEPRIVELAEAPAHRYMVAQVLAGMPDLPRFERPHRVEGTAQVSAGWRRVDPVRAFADAGLYGRPLGNGKHAVVCPWVDGHTQKDYTGRSGDAVLWERGASGVGVFHCAHASCAGRYLAHAISAISSMQAY